MDIIVTTPKRRSEDAAREAETMIRAGGGRYFRRLHKRPATFEGDRIFYVEDGFVRGFGVVDEVSHGAVYNDFTNLMSPTGWNLYYYAQSWLWIRPIPMIGFQGFRYRLDRHFRPGSIEIVGGWDDPRPEIES